MNFKAPHSYISPYALSSALWFALYAQWMTIVPIIIPDYLSTAVEPARRELVTGLFLGAGAGVALIVAPIVGALSDRAVGRRGRRRPYLITGTVGSCIALVALWFAGTHGNVWAYLLAFLLLQFCWNWTAGPYAGLIPDVTPRGKRALASAWLSAMTVLGTMFGNALLMVLFESDRPGGALLSLIAVNVVCLFATLLGIREPAATADAVGISAKEFFKEFYIDPFSHRPFYLVLVARFFCNLGVWSVFGFLVFYLGDVIGLDNPSTVLSALLVLGASIAVPASFIGAFFSRSSGPAHIVRVASWIMALAAIWLVLVALHPSIVWVVMGIAAFSAAYGVFLSADWTLALAVLPSLKSSGKDMGIWHISMVVPQIVGPIGVGSLITIASHTAGTQVGYVVAFAIASCCFAFSAHIVGRVKFPA